MAYNILKEKLCKDVFNYVLLDYMIPNKEYWRKQFDKNIKSLNYIFLNISDENDNFQDRVDFYFCEECDETYGPWIQNGYVGYCKECFFKNCEKYRDYPERNWNKNQWKEEEKITLVQIIKRYQEYKKEFQKQLKEMMA